MEKLQAIRQRVAQGMQQSAAIEPMLQGNGDIEVYKKYLINVYCYAQHSAKVIALAAARCMKDHPELGKYLLRHSEEEEGHDKWVLEDLLELGISNKQAKSEFPVPACGAMVGYTHYLATYANPVSILGWLYILESMGDDLGSTLGELLNKNLNLNNKALRFVKGHGVNDIEHTADIVDQLENNVPHPADMKEIEHSAEVVGDLYIRLFNEIAD